MCRNKFLIFLYYNITYISVYDSIKYLKKIGYLNYLPNMYLSKLKTIYLLPFLYIHNTLFWDEHFQNNTKLYSFGTAAFGAIYIKATKVPMSK